ncbi:MAG: CDP-diacylglycerol--serine O-phosphatidyltransferase [Gemmatimonas sp.]|nr:CDP-diacylglycerol--serine O-phosphatidyltransferase [Gemmatimonadaceae bacterium]
MNAVQRVPARRKAVRRAVVLLPNGLTLFNLFCGIYAIILAIRGDFAAAPAFIVLGGIADTLDGRVARATGTGSRFGEELDSLVDAISFGFAPAVMMYLELPSRGTWEWLLVFIFTSCAVMRLARFNVEQAGRKKTHFHGLPSPAAGLTLATYYWFSQTPLYNQTVILFTDSKTLSDLPWHTILRGLMAILAALMISDVPYPAIPQIGYRSFRQLLGSVVVGGSIILLVVRREEFIFPALLAYVLFGAVKWVIIGFLGRAGTPDEIFWENEPNGAEPRDERRASHGRAIPLDADGLAVASLPDARRAEGGEGSQQPPSARRRKRRRGHRGATRPHGSNPNAPHPSADSSSSDTSKGPTE